MSRSYKHRKSSVIHFKENNDKEHKRNAVIAVRNATEVPNGSQYKKFYCSWNICDYRWIQEKYTRDEFRKKWFDTLHSNKTNVDLILLIFIEKNSALGKKHIALI